MWVARIKLDGNEALLGSRCKKFNVAGSGYPVSIHNKPEGISVYGVYFIFGEDKKVKDFVEDLKKDKRVLHIENQSNFVICNILEPKEHVSAYKESIIHIEPITCNEEGKEFWTIGSWNKEELMEFLDVVEKSHKGELLSIKKEKVKNFSFLAVNPGLTEGQRKALELATTKGYYDYPRKIDIQKLAKLSKLGYTTFHEHLRKAEQKMMPFSIAKTKRLFF